MRKQLIAAGLLLAPLLSWAGEAELIRDEWGVPHIYADEEPVAFYTLGQAMAEDRARRFLGTILWARGELAMLLGPAHLKTDRINRQWRHRQMGAEAAEKLAEPMRGNYSAFLQGFNDWVAAHRPELQASGFKPQLADLLSLSRAMFYAGYHATDALAECGANNLGYNEDLMVVPQAAEPGQSNGWAVSPRRSAAGATIQLADPHVEVDSVAYYEYRLHAGELHSAGFAMGPMLWQAHNENLSWSMTTGAPDMLDCYAVATDPENPSRFRYDDEWQVFERIEETFLVAGGEPVVESFEYSRHNGVLSPVIDRRDGFAYVASVASMHRHHLMHAEIDAMNRAASVAEAKKALKTVAMFPQNLIFADRAGHLWYLRAGTVPRRPAGYDWKRPVPGNSSATAWQGLLALDELVQLADPTAGFVQNNNIAPDVMIVPSPIDAKDWPVDVFNDRPGRDTSRGLRAREVLAGDDSLGFDEALALAMDEKWVTWDAWKMALSDALRRVPPAARPQLPDFAGWVETLLGFDGMAAHDSAAATLFYAWRQELGPLLESPQHAALNQWPLDPSALTTAFAVDMLDALASAAHRLQAVHGRVDVTLGEIIRAGKRGEGIGIGGITIDASSVSLCVASLRPNCERTLRAFSVANPMTLKPQKVLRGSQAMRLVQFSEPLVSMSLYAFGQSDDPASPHFDDQTLLFQQRRMKPTWFDRHTLDKHTKSRRVLHWPPVSTANEEN